MDDSSNNLRHSICVALGSLTLQAIELRHTVDQQEQALQALRQAAAGPRTQSKKQTGGKARFVPKP